MTAIKTNKMQVQKFELDIGSQILKMPKDAHILCIQTRDDIIRMYVLCSPGAEQIEVKITAYGDGQLIENVGDYLGTVRDWRGAWHFFMEVDDDTN